MEYIDFMSPLHKATERDYLGRVNDPEFPKARAAYLAKKWGHDYWDGDRRINYGGYSFIPGRWTPVAEGLVSHYGLTAESSVLDVGCGKGFLLYEIGVLVPGIKLRGLDISEYAIENAKSEVKDAIDVGTAQSLPYPDNSFDLVISINTLHNLPNFELSSALAEIERVSRAHKYICVEAYETETQKANLLYWQVTCEAFCTPAEWLWWFKQSEYSGDYSFIFFD